MPIIACCRTAAETGIAGVVVSLWVSDQHFPYGLRKYFGRNDAFTRAVSVVSLAGVTATLVNSLF
jgi:hypothetical protein